MSSRAKRATPPIRTSRWSRRCARGEPQAELAAWNRFAAGVDQTLRRLLGPGPDREDLLQEVFIRFFRRIGTLREPAAVRGFLTGICIHVVRAEITRRQRRRWLSLTPTGDMPEPAPTFPDLEGREAVTRYYRMLDKLGGKDRSLFVARTHRRDDAGRGGGGARRVRVDGAAADQPRAASGSRRWCGAIRCWRISRASGRRSRHESRGLTCPAGTGGSTTSHHRRAVAGGAPDRGRGRGAGADAGGLAPAAGASRARARVPPVARALLLAGAGMAAAVTLLVVARGVQRARPVTYVVEDAARAGRLHPRQRDGASQVRFSDGTHVDLAQGARVSVLSRGPRGARLRVEEGEARFDVVHLPRAAWSVEAGPYVVYVTGTAFDVRWSGAERGDRGAHAIGLGAGGRAAAPRAGHPARRAASDREAGERRAA